MFKVGFSYKKIYIALSLLLVSSVFCADQEPRRKTPKLRSVTPNSLAGHDLCEDSLEEDVVSRVGQKIKTTFPLMPERILEDHLFDKLSDIADYFQPGMSSHPEHIARLKKELKAFAEQSNYEGRSDDLMDLPIGEVQQSFKETGRYPGNLRPFDDKLGMKRIMSFRNGLEARYVASNLQDKPLHCFALLLKRTQAPVELQESYMSREKWILEPKGQEDAKAELFKLDEGGFIVVLTAEPATEDQIKEFTDTKEYIKTYSEPLKRSCMKAPSKDDVEGPELK